MTEPINILDLRTNPETKFRGHNLAKRPKLAIDIKNQAIMQQLKIIAAQNNQSVREVVLAALAARHPEQLQTLIGDEVRPEVLEQHTKGGK